MFWHLESGAELRPRFYLNGFPKAGLHLAVLMVSGSINPMPSSRLHPSDWLGTFGLNSWVNVWEPIELFTHRMMRLLPGHYFKGHAGWRQDIDDFMRLGGVSQVFIYRDLRDVVVSQAHHIIEADGVRYKHPAPAAYTAMGGFNEVLAACIEGLGPFPGVLERWELYAPWLDAEWVLSVRFEDMIADRGASARAILEYGLERTLAPFDMGLRVEGTIFDNAVKEMVEMSRRTSLSPTFRKGEFGGWRDAFTDDHVRLFKGHDRAGWLVRLGYEKSEDW